MMTRERVSKRPAATRLDPLRTYSSGPAIDEALRQKTYCVVLASNPVNEKDIKHNATTCIEILNDSDNASRLDALNVLLDCGAYYLNIGRHVEAYRLVTIALSHSEEFASRSCQRKAHNLLGVICMRWCDFSRACTHMENAFSLAKELRDEISILSASSNAVALMISMGLLCDARDLALKVLDQPQGNIHLDNLHLSNASNGMRVSHTLRDLNSAEVFFRFAVKKMEGAAPAVSEITRAYFEAAKAEHLALTGYPEQGLISINAAIKGTGEKNNIRISVSLSVALSEVNIAIGDVANIIDACKKLELLIPASKELPDKHEEVLRAIIKNYIRQSKEYGDLNVVVAHYLNLLREHLIFVKHGRFFAESSAAEAFSKMEGGHLQNPWYEVPDWILEIKEKSTSTSMRAISEGRDGRMVDRVVPSDLKDLAAFESDVPFRCEQFNVAENWAVASEFAAGGSGRRCFQVGKLAMAIAMELGWDSSKAKMLELACRLHDVGNIATAFGPADRDHLRAFGKFSLVCEHTIVGEKLLCSSTSDLLQLASVIAKSHHEWWNGCGYPSSIRKEAIPIEARICHFSDTFLSLVAPAGSKGIRWPLDRAVLQIRAMCGVQLDPGLLDAFLRVTNKYLENVCDLSGDVGLEINSNRLIQAKKDLYSALEQV